MRVWFKVTVDMTAGFPTTREVEAGIDERAHVESRTKNPEKGVVALVCQLHYSSTLLSLYLSR
jgi:hypothetical protein